MWSEVLCTILALCSKFSPLHKMYYNTEAAEISLEVTRRICFAMKELPAKACFLWSLAQIVPACLFRCTKLVYFFINASILLFLARMAWYRRGRVWYSVFDWYVIFRQLWFVCKRNLWKCFTWVECIWSPFDLFPTTDCVFHIYMYVCIHLWVGREGEDGLSCWNDQSIIQQPLLLLILKYVMGGVGYSNHVVAER